MTKKPALPPLSGLIRQKLTEKGMALVALGNAVGVSGGVIGRWVGTNTYPPNKIESVLQALGLGKLEEVEKVYALAIGQKAFGNREHKGNKPGSATNGRNMMGVVRAVAASGLTHITLAEINWLCETAAALGIKLDGRAGAKVRVLLKR